MKQSELRAQVLKDSAVQETLRKLHMKLASKSDAPNTLKESLESCVGGIVMELTGFVFQRGFDPELLSEEEFALEVAKLSSLKEQPEEMRVRIFRAQSLRQKIDQQVNAYGHWIKTPELRPSLQELAATVTAVVSKILKIKDGPMQSLVTD